MSREVAPFDALLHQIKTKPTATAFIYKGKVWTYARLGEEVVRLARGLTLSGVESGHRVALHLQNGPEMIAAYYACFQLQAIACPLRSIANMEEVGPLLRRLAPAIYLGDAALYEKIASVDETTLPRDRRIVVNGAGMDGLRSWSQLLARSGERAPIRHSKHDAAAVLINTSGTSALPKIVAHSRTTLARSAFLIATNWNLSDDDIMTAYLPLAHIGGLMSMLCCVQLGLPFVLFAQFDADDVLDGIERYRCSWSVGFPAHYAALLEAQWARSRDISSLRICLSAADVCPLELQVAVSKCFKTPLFNLWIATEAVGSLTYGLKPGPVVRLAKGAKIRIVDEDGEDVAGGQPGELLIRGSNVFMEYWTDLDATREVLRGGWYHTGDIVRRGEYGDLWYVSRKADIIVVGGANVSPLEVEAVLLDSPLAVAEAAVVGVPDPELGQRVFGFVTLVKGADSSVECEILRWAAANLANHKVPTKLVILGKMPRNASSNVDRNALKAIAAGALQQRLARSSRLDPHASRLARRSA